MQEITFKISDEMYERLQAISQKTGRSAIEHITQSIQEHIERLEEGLLSQERCKDCELVGCSSEDIEELIQYYYGTDD